MTQTIENRWQELMAELTDQETLSADALIDLCRRAQTLMSLENTSADDMAGS